MSTPAIGALRDRLTLESSARTGDGGGGATLEWSPLAELWGAVSSINGEERLRADAIAGSVTHQVWIRHRSDVVPAMRFRSGTRILEIVAVLVTPRRTHLQCLCEERHL
jgi:SPP1 family predicted phage head-tail adaptor